MSILAEELKEASDAADSYHRFWIEERKKRIALESAMPDLVKALEAAKDQLRVHGLSPYTMEIIDAALAKVKQP